MLKDNEWTLCDTSLAALVAQSTKHGLKLYAYVPGKYATLGGRGRDYEIVAIDRGFGEQTFLQSRPL